MITKDVFKTRIFLIFYLTTILVSCENEKQEKIEYYSTGEVKSKKQLNQSLQQDGLIVYYYNKWIILKNNNY